jgi:hypothetical protein
MPGQPHDRIILNGTLGPIGSPYEIWSLGLAIDVGGDFGWTGDRAPVLALLQGWFSHPEMRVADQAHCRQVAISHVGADGRQVGETERLPVDWAGGSQSSVVPPQIALRVSLSSGLRGRSQRGGFYLPVPVLGIDAATGLVAPQAVGLILDRTAAMIDALNGLVEGRVVVPSQVVGNVPVDIVRVGRRLDTIRRRANALPESYLSRSIA